MKKIDHFILKKIFENKFRFILMLINFTLGIFLLLLIITISLNFAKNNIEMINKTGFYKQIKIDSNDHLKIKDIENLKQNPKIAKIQVEIQSEFIIKKIGAYEIVNGLFVSQVDSNYDLIIDSDELLYGEKIKNDSEIMISQQYLDFYGISSNDILEKNISLSNGAVEIDKKIVAVYNRDEDNIFLSHLITYSSSGTQEIKQLVLVANNIYDVDSVSDDLSKLGFAQTNYLEKIEILKSSNAIYTVLFIFIGILLFVSCSSILNTTLKVSIKSKYTFIAMLKVFGFNDKKLESIVSLELSILTILSLFLSFILYFLVLYVLPIFISTDSFLLNAAGSIFTINFWAIFLTIFFVIALTCIISIKPKKMIKNCDIIALRKEGDE